MEKEHPIMYAIAYRREEGYWVSFDPEFDETEDISDLDFSCLLPSKVIAEQFIEDRLCDDYQVVEVQIEKYHNGITVFAYNEPKEWNE